MGTTFLALVLLGGSTSHTFLTFFKVFFLTVVFGLFHGLALLPVLLTWVGPVDPEEAVSEVTSLASSSQTNAAYSDDEKPGVLGQAWSHLFPKKGSWSPPASLQA